MQILKLQREYNAGPIWDDQNNLVDVDTLPISNELKKRIHIWQEVYDKYFQIMEIIPGGGWSHHTEEEFEKARKSLGFEHLPSDEDDKKESELIHRDLISELSNKEYTVIYKGK